MSNKQIAVEYIGAKARKEDNVANSGTVWHGAGDIQMVDANTWGKLAAHPGVWRKAEESTETPPAGSVQLSQAKAAGTEGANGDKKSGGMPSAEELAKNPQAHPDLAARMGHIAQESAKPAAPTPTPTPAPAPVARKTAAKAAGTEGAKEGGAQ
jgi:hypothetical protein